MKKLRAIAIGVALLVLLPAINAQAETPAHPILNAYTGATAYSGTLMGAIHNTGVPNSGALGGAAVSVLESALKTPDNRPHTVVAPRDPRIGEPAVIMGIPPHSAYNYAAIPVCLEHNNKIVGKWMISTTGNVTPDFSQVAQMPNKSVCQSWIYPQGVAWMQQNAQIK
jgi:hypothetical protein